MEKITQLREELVEEAAEFEEELADYDHRVQMEIATGRDYRGEDPVALVEPRGVSFQMEQDEFERMEQARLGLRVGNRSTFIKDALAYYAGEFERTGQRPGSRAARSKGDQIVEFLETLGINSNHWEEFLNTLSSADVLSRDSYWRLVLGRIAALTED